MGCRESYGQKVVIFLFAFMVGIGFCFLISHQRGCSRTMVTVGNIQVGDLIKFFCDGGY